MRFSVGDKVQVVHARNPVDGIIVEDDGTEDCHWPYRVAFEEEEHGWYGGSELELITRAGVGIDPQKLSDFMAQYNAHSDDLVAEVSEHFNLPKPTSKKKKYVEVTLRIPQGEVHGFDSAEVTGAEHLRNHRNDLQNMIHNVNFVEIEES